MRFLKSHKDTSHGRNEKELNEELVKMSVYYGFRINVTNCFKANEKGHVEKSVDVLRNQIFADNWSFNSLVQFFLEDE